MLSLSEPAVESSSSDDPLLDEPLRLRLPLDRDREDPRDRDRLRLRLRLRLLSSSSLPSLPPEDAPLSRLPSLSSSSSPPPRLLDLDLDPDLDLPERSLAGSLSVCSSPSELSLDEGLDAADAAAAAGGCCCCCLTGAAGSFTASAARGGCWGCGCDCGDCGLTGGAGSSRLFSAGDASPRAPPRSSSLEKSSPLRPPLVLGESREDREGERLAELPDWAEREPDRRLGRA